MGYKEMFNNLNKTNKSAVKLGDDKVMKAEGRGIISITTSDSKMKLLSNVQYVPKLAHNLLSVGQLIASGCTFRFEDGACLISDKRSGQQLTRINMTHNHMFLFVLDNVGSTKMAIISRIHLLSNIVDIGI